MSGRGTIPHLGSGQIHLDRWADLGIGTLSFVGDTPYQFNLCRGARFFTMHIPPRPHPTSPHRRAWPIIACVLGLLLGGCSDQKRVELRWKVFGEIGEVDSKSTIDLDLYEAKANPLPGLKELVGKRVTVKDL